MSNTNLTQLRNKLAEIRQRRRRILSAKESVSNLKIINLNKNNSFAYIASNENMDLYWNIQGTGERDDIRKMVQNELNQMNEDLNSLSSFANELLVKAEEEIIKLEDEIERLEEEIARIEASMK